MVNPILGVTELPRKKKATGVVYKFDIVKYIAAQYLILFSYRVSELFVCVSQMIHIELPVTHPLRSSIFILLPLWFN